ncbi:MAG: hypothetical protein KatS3mg119_0588 [Rhodothalassiaceae bacterium]|nr:MAG: hypothetical protein KatS3mg119_0588 [Rhodothalassiaceae bacterium]
MTRPAADWLAALDAAGIPAGPVQDIADALSCPQAVARALVQEIADAALGRVPTLASPLRLSRTPPRLHLAPPMLGAHTEEVLAELGLAAHEIARLRESGVIA